MADVNIRITNLPQIKAAFSKSPGLMTKNLNLAIRKTMLYIEAKSKINTPVKTARLRNSHRSLFSNLRGEVGTHTDYDIYVHNGTRYMQARPYLKDAAEESQNTIDSNFKSAVQNTLNEIGRMV